MSPETQQKVATAILALPASEQEEAARAFEAVLNEPEEKFSEFIDDPERFCVQVLGSVPWSRTQRALADEFWSAAREGRPSRILALGGNGTGKSHIEDDLVFAAWCILGWKRDPAGDHQGVVIILTAPTATNIKATAYYQLLARGRKAAARGYFAPGWEKRKAGNYAGASDASIKWEDGPWRMIGLSPKASASGDVAHSAGGIHGKGVQIIRAEEAMGLLRGMIAAIEGLGVAANVLYLFACNPTTTSSFLFGHMKANPHLWTKFEFTKLEHPNVIARRTLIPGAVSHQNLEAALRSAVFEDRGPWPGTEVDDARLDVIYALPPLDMEDKLGPRDDGHPGHPDAELRVFRPLTDMAAGQNLGRYREADTGALLFQVSQITTQMAAGGWRRPDGPPVQVGVDCAPTRPPVACPRWGTTARAAVEAENAEPGSVVLGVPHEVPWEGADLLSRAAVSAKALVAQYGTVNYAIDVAYGGEVASALAALGATVDQVQYNDKPAEEPLEVEGAVLYGEALNLRVEMMIHAAAAFNRGLISIPFSQRVLDQMVATGPLVVSKMRSGAKGLRPKKDIEGDLGYSPDDLDSVGLALSGARKIQAIDWSQV